MTEGKHTFNELKKFCKSASIKELQAELKDKELELMRKNAEVTKGRNRLGYNAELTKGSYVPIKNIRKQIAVIKTYLNQKMLRNAK